MYHLSIFARSNSAYISGSGEALRGTFNSIADQTGEAIAGRGSNDAAPPTRTEGGQRPADVAGKGADELKAGMNAFKRN